MAFNAQNTEGSLNATFAEHTNVNPDDSANVSNYYPDDESQKRPLTSDSKVSNGGTIYMVMISLLSAIGGFLFGYDTGIVSGAMLFVKVQFNLTSLWQEIVVSVTIGTAAVFALVSGWLSAWLGRRLCILLASIVFLLGSVILAIAQNRSMLVIGRIIVGAGIGLASMIVPVYLAETSPAHLRGRLVTLNTVFITGGQFVAALTAGAFSSVSQGWRYMLGLAGVPALLQIVCFAWLPESPRWLVSKERLGAARSVLVKLRGGSDKDQDSNELVDSELREIVAKNREEMRAMADREKDQSGSCPRPILLQMLEQPWTRRALLIGCGLQAFQQLSGINTVMYYSASIVKMAGVRDDATAVWLSAVTAGTNFFACFIGLCLVERIGRRPLLIGSLCGVIVSLVVLAIGFQVIRDNSMPVSFEVSNLNNTHQCLAQPTCDSCISQMASSCGFCYSNNNNGTCVSDANPDYLCPTKSAAWFLAKDYCPTPYAWIVLLGLISYLAFFSPGMAPVPWLINSELYPLWGRSAGSGLATCINWTCNLLVSLTFLSLTELLTKHGTYWLYAGLAALALLFVIRFVPETKGKSLEEIEFMLENNA